MTLFLLHLHFPQLSAAFHNYQDYDIDCEGDLVCFDPDDVIGIVPGCEGSPTTSWEYCTDLESIKDYARHRAKIALLNPISTEKTTSNTP